MNEALIEFKKRTLKAIEENPKLKALDEKIAKLKLEMENRVFKVKKRLERLEINKFGYSLSTNNDNGKN